MSRSRGLTRILIRTGICLLLGVVVSYAVAEFAYWMYSDRSARSEWSGFKLERDVRWAVSVQDSLGATSLQALAPAPGSYVTKANRIPPWVRRSSLEGRASFQFAAGWPRRCVRCWFFDPSPTRTTFWRHGGVIGSAPDSPLLEWRPAGAGLVPEWVPIAPYWLGLIFNTLFYADPIFLLWTFIPAVRRSFRRRRHRCPQCNYPRADLAADQACPKCGQSCKS